MNARRLGWIIWAALAAAMILAPMVLSGCATGFTGTCAMQHVGTTDDGVEVFRLHCAPA